ncbi:MAG TPA: NAD(P)/FAD-dependent oxidoreductase, partial [Gemmatimonadales bacterium]|nr:NAD(P)/FAD-dependent oxidoreductase [Gemmatimonadales bacterium]
AIVIGAGVNGLVAAHYLARAGRRVLVVERHVAPDAAADVGWIPPQVIRELELRGAGRAPRIEQPDPWITAPLDGGGRLELSRDVARSAEAIRRISPADAAKWPEFCARMRNLAGVLERLYVAPPPDIESRDPRELLRLAGLGLHVRRLGKQTIIDLARILPMPIADLLDDWFESDVLKGVVGAVGVWHLKQGPRSGGTAFNFLHHHVGSPAGVFRPPRSNIKEVLLGIGDIELRLGVTARPTGRGVVLEPSGDELVAPLVVSSADPRATFAGLKADLYPEFVRAVDNIKCRGVVARGTLQFDRSAPVPPDALCLAPTLDHLERAYDDAKYGRTSAQPYIEAHAQAGDGRVEVHVQYVAAADPQLKEKVAAALNADPAQLTLQTPQDLEREYGLTEGHLYHGELTLDQILFMRPVAGWSRYRTPISGLYLCGAGTHPGGGIAGAAGRNAARVILKESKRS